MKKNVMMRVASALLVAVLMTTCAISGTFAKYTTTVSDSETARVAKWGFTQDSLTIDLFASAYNSNTIQAENGTDKIIAPGASGEETIVFTPESGKSEVAFTFDVTIAKGNSTNDALLAKLKWKLNGVEVANFSELQTKVAELYEGTVYAANTTTYPADMVIEWEWPFEVDTAGNESDTVLGESGTSVEIVITYVANQYTTLAP